MAVMHRGHASNTGPAPWPALGLDTTNRNFLLDIDKQRLRSEKDRPELTYANYSAV